VAIVSPKDPGNVGSILRTIDAVGASGLILLDSGVDPYHPTAVRASLGSIFWCRSFPLPLASGLYGRSSRVSHLWHFGQGSADYKEIDVYEQPLIILLGSEREGLSREQSAVCDRNSCACPCAATSVRSTSP
jgi:TrmH family RNA methyltransferase